MSSEAYTDASGDAHFDNSPGSGFVYVNGRTVYDGNVAGRVIVYV